jgi:hypothetical protein
VKIDSRPDSRWRTISTWPVLQYNNDEEPNPKQRVGNLAVRLFAALQTLLAEEDFSRFLKKLNHWYPKARTGFN